jgi:hypothetical protein
MSLASAPHYGICRIKTGCFRADGRVFNCLPTPAHVSGGAEIEAEA